MSHLKQSSDADVAFLMSCGRETLGITWVFQVLEPSSLEALICGSPEVTNVFFRPLLYHFGGAFPTTVENTVSTVIFYICEILKLTKEREKIEGKIKQLLLLVRDMKQVSGRVGLKFGSLEILFNIRVMDHVFFLKWLWYLLIFFEIFLFYPKLYIV